METVTKAIDGKKTWIGLIIGQAVIVLNQISIALDSDPSTSPDWALAMGAVVTVIGLVHKLQKGE